MKKLICKIEPIKKVEKIEKLSIAGYKGEMIKRCLK